MTLVLASTSRWRGQLLGRLGLPFEAAAPDFVEGPRPSLSPVEVALAFARGKAASVARLRPEAVVVGADQVAELDGARLDKVTTLAQAEDRLRRLAGQTHRLHSAVAVARGDRIEAAVHTVTLQMRALSPAQIARYVAVDQPLGTAGGYTLEGLGVALFTAIDADDSATVGLPLGRLIGLLRRFGVDPLA